MLLALHPADISARVGHAVTEADLLPALSVAYSCACKAHNMLQKTLPNKSALIMYLYMLVGPILRLYMLYADKKEGCRQGCRIEHAGWNMHQKWSRPSR